MGAFLAIILSVLAIFLILLILVQRGRGGGLAGALGGMGGSSAFGAKAGDVFTRITIITASIWIFFSLVALFWAKDPEDALSTASQAAPADSALDMLPQARPDAKGGEPAVGPAETKDSTATPSSAPADSDAAPSKK
jgi:preprotein translocase subunit SecG